MQRVSQNAGNCLNLAKFEEELARCSHRAGGLLIIISLLIVL